jgi:hypothetical protein
MVAIEKFNIIEVALLVEIKLLGNNATVQIAEILFRQRFINTSQMGTAG